mmetsp:Transcript_84053/g.153455  ORF Transcript_84053/g.153455 Transcript_84053/m.153455 type:complete len:599 (+) Transcript_84053:118-1914(+)
MTTFTAKGCLAAQVFLVILGCLCDGSVSHELPHGIAASLIRRESSARAKPTSQSRAVPANKKKDATAPTKLHAAPVTKRDAVPQNKATDSHAKTSSKKAVGPTSKSNPPASNTKDAARSTETHAAQSNKASATSTKSKDAVAIKLDAERSQKSHLVPSTDSKAVVATKMHGPPTKKTLTVPSTKSKAAVTTTSHGAPTNKKRGVSSTQSKSAVATGAPTIKTQAVKSTKSKAVAASKAHGAPTEKTHAVSSTKSKAVVATKLHAKATNHSQATPSNESRHGSSEDWLSKLLPPAPAPMDPCSYFDAPSGTACPQDKWVSAMVLADPAPGKVIMHFGCDKGNDAVRWLEMFDFSPTRFWSTSKWVKYFRNELDVEKYDCNPQIPDILARQAPLDSFNGSFDFPVSICIEPSKQKFDDLQKAGKALGYTGNTQYGSFQIVRGLVENKKTKPKWFKVDSRNEVIPQIPERASMTQEPPGQMQSVDDVMAKLRLQQVDVLLIDMDGEDSEVIRGSTLDTVRYLEFGVHREIDHSAWNRTSLKYIATKLGERNFDCYWAGNNGRLISIDKCWKESYERPCSANAACVRRDDKWAGILRKFAGL